MDVLAGIGIACFYRRDGIATGLSRALVALEARGLHEATGVVRELLEAAVDRHD